MFSHSLEHGLNDFFFTWIEQEISEKVINKSRINIFRLIIANNR
jgi:hypothetical protein